MADLAQRLPRNAEGPFFVDRTCIDCDACRRLAPATFAEGGGKSVVRVQPRDDDAQAAALRALVTCPVGAIGDTEHHPLQAAIDAFPMRIDGPVSYLGFHARSSYGASSYLLEHPQGNWMIDAPRWNAALARRIAARGGIANVFLTHRDDVADAARYAQHFGARRIIHRADAAAASGAEFIIDGDEPVRIGDVTIVPTPGHTRGHCVLSYGTYLFSGDHLAWDRETGRLDAHRHVCWYDWPTQVRSVARLTAYRFSWLLPGHGDAVQLDPGVMRAAIEALVAQA